MHKRSTTGAGEPQWPGLVRVAIGLVLAFLLAAAGPASALEPIDVGGDIDRMEISALGEIHEGRGDRLTIETAPGADGLVNRISVAAQTPGTNPSWFVFALKNTGDKQIERWLAADRYSPVGSGVVWPDLDARRIEKVTPSVGYVPERIRSDKADVFRLTIEPGQTVTFVAELASERFARLQLWDGIEYEQRNQGRQLFNGIMIGITGLLAIFLTAVFAANHKAIFPSAAIFTWCVLAYLCVDFGFWNKLFNVRPEENAQYRAATEAAMAATLLVFAYTFLRLGAWHGFIRTLLGLWMAAQLALIAIAFLDPRLAATFARLSSLAIAGVGGLLTLFLAMRGQDRALSLVPTWMLLLVWLFGAGVTMTGRLSGDIVTFGLTAGLVLIVVLIGFTVTQYAFRSFEPLYGAQPGDEKLRSLAVDGAGAAVWEWTSRRDEIKVSPVVEAMLGLKAGELSTKSVDFAQHMHPADRERFKLLLASVKERAGGEVRLDFRMRHVDNSYRWFELEAATVPSSDRRNVRCVGLMREVTDAKRAQERLLHDAVHDSLTGLPNRELFLDRLAIAAKRATLEPLVRPALLFIDIDKFKTVNTAFGLVVGDSLLLTVARRLARNLGPQDTLGRIGGDQFALLLLAQSDARELAMLAEQIRRSLRSPITIAGQEIVLTASIGIALYDGPDEDPAELLREAEIAMYRAKRAGTDRIEIFNAEMREDKDGRVALENELRRAIEKKQLRLLYQPIIYLPTGTLAGFEALLRWDHPRLGSLNPTHFVPLAEESDLIVKLGSYVLTRAVREAQRWQKELPRPDAPVFVSVNVSSRQLFRPELVNEVRHILGRAVIPKGSLRLEITESLAMENPEKAMVVLQHLSAAGAGLSLDDFGTGYSSLSYLNQFTFDTIKIDRAFVQSSGQNPGSIVLRSIVALAHELGKKVVAEGVEIEDDVVFLRSIGCEYAQGFYYSEPLSDRDALHFVRLERKAERRMRKKKSGFRKRPQRPPETPPVPAGPAPAPVAVPPPVAIPVEARTAPPPQAHPAGNGAAAPRQAPPPLPRPGGPPPIPNRPPPPPAEAAAGGVRIDLPPTPLRPGAPPHQHPAAAEPTVQTAAPTGPPPLRPTAPHGNHPGAPPPRPASSRPPPDFSKLPPNIAASLAKLAGNYDAKAGASTQRTAEPAAEPRPPNGKPPGS